MKTKTALNTHHGVGRRKSAVARVWLKPGKGDLLVNGESFESYFPTDASRSAAAFPFKAFAVAKQFDAHVNVVGGGVTGQSDATKLGICRALLAYDETLRVQLREQDMLTVDSRVKERKKYGQRGARRKFQFVKR
jgi:small subunit ribosomal protein S9